MKPLPLQLYEKEQILDACLAVFARHGYERTSTAMLAEAAGISKALIFHHFKSKKDLYFCVLERCIQKVQAELRIDDLPEYEDFFEAIDHFCRIELDYFKENPDEYKVLMEVFYATPKELKADIEEKMGSLIATRYKVLERLFDKVPLKEGVDRRQAFELIWITLKHLEDKFVTGVTDKTNLDEKYMERMIDEMNRFLTMIRYGIER
jgi:TetR/AcrR family transcriptional regulator